MEYAHRNPEKVREGKKAWHKKNREALNEASRQRNLRNVQTVIEAFGGKCAGCGVTERLVLDHVNDDGAQHRRERPGSSGSAMYSRLAKDPSDTDGYELQLLCPNCHFDKTWPTRAPSNK